MTTQRISLLFRDIDDSVNRRKVFRTFVSPIFDPSVPEDKTAALRELETMFRRDGFTVKGIIKAKVIDETRILAVLSGM